MSLQPPLFPPLPHDVATTILQLKQSGSITMSLFISLQVLQGTQIVFVIQLLGTRVVIPCIKITYLGGKFSSKI